MTQLKKIVWFIGFVISLSLFHNVSAYLDCTPTTCDTGYTDFGVTCEESTCIRACIAIACNMNWTEVHSSTFGWNDTPNAVAMDASATSYTADNESLCYRYQYDGPLFDSDSYVWLAAANPSSGDCDTQGIGGFKSSSDWFSQMAFHLGNPPGNTYDELVKAVRGSAEQGSNQPYKTAMTQKNNYIYCAPTTLACNEFGGYLYCQEDCYGNPTYGWVRQGYFVDTNGNDNTTLYNNNPCSPSTLVTHNRMLDAVYKVWTSGTYPTSNTANKTCDRINEPPIIYDVKVLPESPNAGQNLECTFNYTDVENFQEQGSTFEWWKNSANQNINAPILDKGNLTVSDSWLCKATPSDGLTFGNQSTSTNSVTIQTTIKDPSFVIGNNLIWTGGGYYGGTEEIFDFNDTLQSAIDSCTPNQAGLCTIDLIFSSSATGTMDLSNMQIFYTQPQPNIKVQNLTQLNATSLTAIIGFEIFNELIFDRTVNWTLDFGDNNNRSNAFDIILNTSETAFVFNKYTYGGAGTYLVTATAFNDTYSSSQSINVMV